MAKQQSTTDKFLVATAIPYVNDRPHLGHALEAIYADVLARYYRQQGREVIFTTGTDEHGSKIVEAAAQQGVSPPGLGRTVIRLSLPRACQFWG